MRMLALIAAAAAASACTAAPAEEPVTQPTPAAACNAAPAQHLVGRARSAAVGAEAKRLTGATLLRWIPEGTMVTMDYREDRLNLDLDAHGKIIKVRCG
jgi:hypothetical protein